MVTVRELSSTKRAVFGGLGFERVRYLEKVPPQKEIVSSHHPFSGVKMLVSGRVSFCHLGRNSSFEPQKKPLLGQEKELTMIHLRAEEARRFEKEVIYVSNVQNP